VVPIAADVGSAEDCGRAVEAAAGRGRLEVVVNVAGIMVDDDSVETIADEDLERLFRVNVFGVVRLARAAIPVLRRGGGGVIVNVSSVHAYASQERAAAYGASKGAISTLTRQMAVDLAPDGIRVVGVAPGSVDTPLTRAEIRRRGVTIEEAGFSRDRRALGHVADPADIAEVVAFLASERASIVTGQTLIADGGLLTRFAGS
jgi:NAD(P)-dependent dehydrogenase (short-subunit alcohol dehydrogenase family)